MIHRFYTAALFLMVLMTGCATPPGPNKQSTPVPEFPEERFLTATGIGQSEAEARRQALGEMAGIFESRISADTSSKISSFMDGSTGEHFEKSIESRVRVESTLRLRGVRIGKVWQTPDNGLYHALAVLDRQQAAREWLQRLDRLVTQIDADIESLPRIEGRLPRLVALNRILALVLQRAAVESRLGVIGHPSWGTDDIDLKPILTEAAALRANATFYVAIAGEGGDAVSDLIRRSLGENDLHVTDRIEDAAGIIRGDVDLVPLALNNAGVHFVRANTAVRIEDADTGIRIHTISETIRKGHVDKTEAYRMAIDAVSDLVIQQLLDKLGLMGVTGSG